MAPVCPYPCRLIQLRMDREDAETRVRKMEDQLAEYQDEMRKETGSKTVSQKHNGEQKNFWTLDEMNWFSRV